MAEEQVHVTGHAAAEPAAVWSVAGDFCAAWHPAIATIRAERDGRGALIRAFTAKGEDTLYREQLVYRSDSDRVLSYTHLEGIAGADKKFVWAQAKIVGPNKVEVWSDKVAEPAAVRYAWADNPVCNLYSGVDLPVTPFRTDDWPGVTLNNTR